IGRHLSNRFGFVSREDRVDGIHMAQGRPLLTVDQWRGRVREDLCLEEIEYDAPVLFVGALKALLLPPLAFVSPQIEDVEGPVWLPLRMQLALLFDQSLP